jgi:predicted dehydrogenase
VAVVVGCGRIAGGFNETSEALALTHAVAYGRLGIAVAACCDVDPARARAFAARWGVPRHGVRLEDVMPRGPAVVSVCTPPSAQAGILQTIVASASVRAVLLEKPLGATLADATGLAGRAREWGRPVLVNYFRAFTAFYQEIEAQIRQGRWGAPRDATVHYTGTFDSHAGHALERLVALFGPPVDVAGIGAAAAAPLFEARFAGGLRALFVPLPRLPYSVFELELFFEEGRLRIVDSERRVEAFTARPDGQFAGYSALEGVAAPGPEITYEMVGSVEATVNAARSGRDDSGMLARALEVARVRARLLGA